LGVAYLVVIAVDIILTVFATPLLSLYGLSGETSGIARQLLIYQSAVSIFIWPIAFCLPPALRAASDVKFTMVISVVSMWVFRVALAYVISLEVVSLFGGIISFNGFGVGVMGVWIAMTIDWVFRTILFLWRFLSGKWLSKYREETEKA
jgi:Na+-driven multidrug efflux pump